MKVRTFFSISFCSGASLLTGGILTAQETGYDSYTSAEPGLYRPVDTPIMISPNFRRENDDSDSSSYPSFSEVPVKDAVKEVIPPPPIPREAPKIEAPKVVVPKVESPKIVASKIEPPKIVAPKAEPPKIVAPKIEAPKVETSRIVNSTPVQLPKVTPTLPPIEKTISPPSAPRKQEVAMIKNTVPRFPAPAAIGSPLPSTSPGQVGRYSAPQTPTHIAPPVPPMVSRTDVFPPEIPGVQARQVFSAAPQVVPAPDFPVQGGGLPGLIELRNTASFVARQRIEYRFGRSHPAFGGLDSSGAVQYLLSEIGVVGVPRTISGQGTWVRDTTQLREFQSRPTFEELSQGLSPGNLIFWGDPLTGRFSHVMIYMGYDGSRGQHLAFGTRGGTEVGINGNEVDIFDLKLDRERIVATGMIPGLRYY